MSEYNGVYVSCRNMRSWGRQALSGKWAIGVLGSLLMSALMTVPVIIFTFIYHSDTLENVSNIYTFIVSGPLTLGYVSFIIAIFRQKNPSPMEVFYGFEHFFKALGLMLMMNILVLLWSLLFIIPGIIASFRYGMAFYILADNPEMGIMEILRESKKMMYGNKWKLFCLQLSFIGWAILAFLTVGVGYFFLMPYMVAATVAFYEVANGNLRPQYPQLSPESQGSANHRQKIDNDGPEF